MKEKHLTWLLMKAAESRGLIGKFLKNPQAVAKKLGIKLTPKQAAAIRKLVAQLRKAAEGAGGANILLYPLPRISGAPDGKKKKPAPNEV